MGSTTAPTAVRVQHEGTAEAEAHLNWFPLAVECSGVIRRKHPPSVAHVEKKVGSALAPEQSVGGGAGAESDVVAARVALVMPLTAAEEVTVHVSPDSFMSLAPVESIEMRHWLVMVPPCWSSSK